jgi:hypothetical protein
MLMFGSGMTGAADKLGGAVDATKKTGEATNEAAKSAGGAAKRPCVASTRFPASQQLFLPVDLRRV